MTAAAYLWLAGATATLMAGMVVGEWLYDALIDPPDRRDEGVK